MWSKPQALAHAALDCRLHGSVLLLAAVLLLAGCQVQSDIQSRYTDRQSDCRSEAEDKMDAAPQDGTVSSKQRNALLVDYFSTCMIKGGWHVARPVKNPVVPTPPGTAKNPQEAALPAQPLPGQPSDRITAASPRPPQQQTQPQAQPQPRQQQPAPTVSSPPNQPVKTQSSVLQPSPGQPALSQPATGSNAPAGYQRAVDAPVPSGAASPGRKF